MNSCRIFKILKVEHLTKLIEPRYNIDMVNRTVPYVEDICGDRFYPPELMVIHIDRSVSFCLVDSLMSMTEPDVDEFRRNHTFLVYCPTSRFHLKPVAWGEIVPMRPKTKKDVSITCTGLNGVITVAGIVEDTEQYFWDTPCYARRILKDGSYQEFFNATEIPPYLTDKTHELPDAILAELLEIDAVNIVS